MKKKTSSDINNMNKGNPYNCYYNNSKNNNNNHNHTHTHNIKNHD